MPTAQQIIAREFELIVIDLKAKHVSLGMKSSGKWERGLEVQTAEFSGKILGEKYTTQLVQGRKSGKFPPIQAIRQWIVDKGIVNKIKGEISVSSLAFLIARKIAKEGTKYFQQGGTDLISSVITPARIQSIIDKVGAEILISEVNIIKNEFKQIAV